VQLRPWQVGKVTAAWRLYAAALDTITDARAALLERLRQALLQAGAAAADADAAAAAKRAAAGGGGAPLSSEAAAAAAVAAEFHSGQGRAGRAQQQQQQQQQQPATATAAAAAAMAAAAAANGDVCGADVGSDSGCSIELFVATDDGEGDSGDEAAAAGDDATTTTTATTATTTTAAATTAAATTAAKQQQRQRQPPPAGGARAGSGALGQRLRLHSRITTAQLDTLLSTAEYHALCEAINANLAREDSIMILFDYSIGNMLDEVQLSLICVASWPYMPLLGSICKWLVEPHLSSGGAAGGAAAAAEVPGAAGGA
jgi:hypothetical protein